MPSIKEYTSMYTGFIYDSISKYLQVHRDKEYVSYETT